MSIVSEIFIGYNLEYILISNIFSFYIDDSSSDADVFFPVKHLRNLHQLDVQSKSSIPGTSKAANLNSPVKSDGPNSPDNLDDPNIPDYSDGQRYFNIIFI